MRNRWGLQSLFQQKLERALFASYFVGAVIPLLVLAWLVHTFAMPGLAERGFATATVLGVLFGAGLLVMSGYLATRRIARREIASRDRDNAGLSELLATARTLSKSAHAEEVSDAAARCALALLGADAAYVVSRDDEDALRLLASNGVEAAACADGLESELGDLAATALADQRATHLRFDRPTDGASREHWQAVAVPIQSESRNSALVAIRTAADGFGDWELDALDTLSGISAVALDNASLQYAQRNFFAHVTDMLVLALDSHVEGRSGHGARVAALAHRVAHALALDEEMIRRVHLGALLHDLGMLKLTRERQEIPIYFRQHPVIGARMLSRIRLWRDVAPIVLHHHENYDGSGYPDRLAGDEIPIESRIVLGADAFDAMTCEGGTRSAQDGAAALDELRNGMGSQFDPEVVRVFLALVESGEIDA